MNLRDLEGFSEDQILEFAQGIAQEVVTAEHRIKKSLVVIGVPLVAIMMYNPLVYDTMVYAGLMVSWFIGKDALIVYKLRGVLKQLGVEFEER